MTIEILGILGILLTAGAYLVYLSLASLMAAWGSQTPKPVRNARHGAINEPERVRNTDKEA